MEAKRIFKCIGNEIDIIPNEMLESLDISYEDGNRDSSSMAILSKSLKEYEKEQYSTLPFCHTVEPEVLGSIVTLDNVIGNRIGK